MKLEALKKIGGKWQAPEDWTQVAFKSHCLDNQDERLEELLLIVSNSEANRASETPFTFGNLSPMKQATSNVGCWQWFGTASLTTETAFGYTTVESMIGPLIRDRSLSTDPNDALVGLDLFVADSSSRITYSVSGPITGTNCTISGMGTANPKAIGEGSMFLTYLTLDGPPTPLERMAVGSGADDGSRGANDDQLSRPGARGQRSSTSPPIGSPGRATAFRSAPTGRRSAAPGFRSIPTGRSGPRSGTSPRSASSRRRTGRALRWRRSSLPSATRPLAAHRERRGERQGLPCTSN